MQRIAVIATNERDFVRSLLGENTTVAKHGGILVNDFLYIPIKDENGLRGQKFDGAIITKEAKNFYRLKALFYEVFNHLNF